MRENEERYDESDDEDEDDAQRAGSLLLDVGQGLRFLRYTAYLAAFLWIVSVVANAWVTWERLAPIYSNSPNFEVYQQPTPNAVALVAASAFEGSWGYLLVAVVAIAALTFLNTRRLEELLDALDEDDDGASDIDG